MDKIEVKFEEAWNGLCKESALDEKSEVGTVVRNIAISFFMLGAEVGAEVGIENFSKAVDRLRAEEKEAENE